MPIVAVRSSLQCVSGSLRYLFSYTQILLLDVIVMSLVSSCSLSVLSRHTVLRHCHRNDAPAACPILALQLFVSVCSVRVYVCVCLSVCPRTMALMLRVDEQENASQAS